MGSGRFLCQKTPNCSPHSSLHLDDMLSTSYHLGSQLHPSCSKENEQNTQGTWWSSLSDGWRAHIRSKAGRTQLKQVLERVKSVKVTLNPTKYEFNHATVKFLGHVIDRHGIRADPDKIGAICRMEAPHTLAIGAKKVPRHGESAEKNSLHWAHSTSKGVVQYQASMAMETRAGHSLQQSQLRISWCNLQYSHCITPMLLSRSQQTLLLVDSELFC